LTLHALSDTVIAVSPGVELEVDMKLTLPAVTGVALALGLLAAPLATDAQPHAKVPRIGMLMPVSADIAATNIDAFRQGLRDLGYVEGQNVAFEYRYAQGKDNLLPDLAAELVRLKVDVIVTWGTLPAQAAKQATTTIPIVMAAVGDPIGPGIVPSLARPGGNITGLTSLAVDTEAKRLQLLKEVVPKASRVGVFWNPANPFSALALKQTQVAAQELRMKLLVVGVRVADEFEDAFAAMTRERPDALTVQGEVFLLDHKTRILNFAARSRLPAMYGFREFVDAGGLMFYGPRWPDLFRRAAVYVDKILKGAKPADLPVEQPTRFELVINLKTAKALGLKIPQSVLIRAVEVIQ
jgi:putative ABC transport system substrate-binding protein